MSNTSQLEELFLRSKPVRLLLALKLDSKSKYVSTLSKETDCTYSHTVKLLEQFRELGLVSFEKEGRVKYITLSQNGRDIATNFESILRRFSKMKHTTPSKTMPAKPSKQGSGTPGKF